MSNHDPFQPASEDIEDGEEEGEEIEEDSGSDDDVAIITERPGVGLSQPEPSRQQPSRGPVGTPLGAPTDASKPPEQAPSTAAPPKPNTSSGGTAIPLSRDKTSSTRPDSSAQTKPGHEYPEVRTSSVDISEENPRYKPLEKPLQEIDMDADLAEHDKPWRRPGARQEDYFNYGLDEFTWGLLCEKQKAMRENAKQMRAQTQEMERMFGGGTGGGPNGPQMGAGGAIPGMPGMPGQPGGQPGQGGMPDMEQMMQQMQAAGMNPMNMNQDDFARFMMSQQGGGGFGGGGYGGGQGGPGGYGGPGGGPGGMEYGGGGGAGGRGGGGRGGRGRRW